MYFDIIFFKPVAGDELKGFPVPVIIQLMPNTYLWFVQSLIHDNETFEDITYAEKVIKGQEFHDCVFKKCDFSNSEFLNNKFIDCVFEGCNLSMMKLGGSTLNNAVFKQCKILGLNFSQCQDFLFTVKFEACIVDYASFMGKKMIKTNFIKSSLKEVSFSGANLSGSVFDHTDLLGAVFNQTDLTSVNFATAFNYSLDPELNILKKAIFSIDGVTGLLSKYNIKIV
jgi:fluoroquinolone resistance protein